MLKIPKVTIETADKIIKILGPKENEEKEKHAERLQNILEEFASEQPALLTMLSQIKSLDKLPEIMIPTIIYKMIKTECEKSELESFMDVK